MSVYEQGRKSSEGSAGSVARPDGGARGGDMERFD
jgi:hypothetical protein